MKSFEEVFAVVMLAADDSLNNKVTMTEEKYYKLISDSGQTPFIGEYWNHIIEQNG